MIPGNRRNDMRKLCWNSATERAFLECKNSLANTALLQYPDASKTLGLMVDASDVAAGAVLQQLVNGVWKPE